MDFHIQRIEAKEFRRIRCKTRNVLRSVGTVSVDFPHVDLVEVIAVAAIRSDRVYRFAKPSTLTISEYPDRMDMDVFDWTGRFPIAGSVNVRRSDHQRLFLPLARSREVQAEDRLTDVFIETINVIEFSAQFTTDIS